MAIATVVNVKGEVFAVNKEGVKRRLQKGDQVQEGEILVTAPGSSAELDMGGGKTVQVAEQQTFAVDGSVGGPAQPSAATSALESAAAAQKVIQALAAGDANALLEAEAAAAGLAGGGAADGGSSFVQLLRISEGVTPVSYDYGNFALGGADQPTPGAIEEITVAPPTILVGNGDLFAESAEAEVFEPALSPSGSNSGGNGEFVIGQFLVSDPEGVASLVSVTINGVVIPMGDLVGTVIPGAHGTLTITGFDPNTGLASFSYELTEVTTDVDGVEETDVFTFTTTDGTLTSNEATVTINIVDDVPTAVNDEPEALAEDTSIDIDVFANDTEGADGVDLVTGVALEAGPSKGSVVYNGDGTFTYTPDAGEEGADSFTYTITDSDGDTSTATVNLVLAEDSKPTIGDESGEVDESALGDGSGGGTVVASGTLDITTGNDSIAAVRVNGQDVTGGGSIITALGTLVITETDGVYTWEYTLNDNSLDHTTQGMSDDGVLESFSLEVEDSDGSTDPGTLTVTVNDDVPNIESITNVVMANESKIVTGQIEYEAGADGVDAFVISSIDDGGLATTVTGIGTDTVTGLDAEGNPIYILTVDGDGEYHFELLQTSQEGEVQFDLTGVKAGAPVTSISFTDPDDPSATIIFMNAKDADGDPETFSKSNGAFGIGSNLFNKGESWTTDFTGFLASTFTLAYTFEGSGSLTVNYTAYDSNGDTFTGSFVVSASGSQTVDFIAAGDFDGLVDHIDFSITSNQENQSAKIKLTEFSAETITPADDQSITVGVQLLDGDGDITVEETFTIDVVANDADTSTSALNVTGGTGDDVLAGGSGNDILTGGAGGDIFQWTLGDEGTGVTPAVDIIADFGNGTDKIDLRDLLQGEHDGSGIDVSNLSSYLVGFDYVEATNSTIVNVSTHGDGVVDQQIVLAAVDITDAGALSDAAIITNLLSQQKLVVDS
jgi:hypothetical protein